MADQPKKPAAPQPAPAPKQELTTADKEMLQEYQDEKNRKAAAKAPTTRTEMGKMFKGGGSVSASKRADGIAQRGKTKGRMV